MNLWREEWRRLFVKRKLLWVLLVLLAVELCSLCYSLDARNNMDEDSAAVYWDYMNRYAGEMTMYRDEQAGTVCCYYGRVEDPAIETVAVSVRGEIYDETTQTACWEEATRLTAEPENFMEWKGHRHFLLSHIITDWPYDSGRQAWVVGYDAAGNVVTGFEIREGTHSYFS